MQRHIPHQPKHSNRSREGTATVEFAVVAPFFLLLLLGIVEMSRALDVSQKLSVAVREGARAAASEVYDKLPIGTTLNQQITTDIKNMLTASGITGNDVNISITHADGKSVGQPFDLRAESNYLEYFRVSASIPYHKVGRFPVRIMKDKDLAVSVVFRQGHSALSE
ncbi:TadE/TadG family type IV pilus assembly protein [Planctomicrobium sp. SH527]|uniref:TadE/TadG family type IV pilus assembly protein n=1 Tax=Planctomicrobium sp. SH527 TaxID=3448123 RepID=UPI003F5CB7D0